MPRKNASTLQLLVKRGGEETEEEEEESTAANFDTDPIKCISLLNPTCTKRAGEKLSGLYLHWRDSQRSSASQIHRQLRARWALDSLIDAHLARFYTHYNRTMLPSHPIDIPHLLFPSWNPPFLTASLSWLGDTWRPSSILSLIVPTLSSPLSPKAHRVLTESIRRFRVQESVLDEEMAEYQSMSVLNLPFGRRRRSRRRRRSDVVIISNEMRKMEGVVGRAQRLRYRAVEVAVKMVLDKTQAAEFLVAFAGIQEMVHRQATRWRARTGAVAITVQAFDATH